MPNRHDPEDSPFSWITRSLEELREVDKDHEARIRSNEKWRYEIQGKAAIIIAGVSLFTSGVASVVVAVFLNYLKLKP